MSFAIEVPGAAVPLNATDLCKALQAGTSSDQNQRQAASQQLDEWQTHANYFSSLQTVFLDRTLPYEVRFLAIILLKNGIDKYWRSSARIKGGLSPDEKALIRSRLLSGTVDESNRTLALHNALATAKIVRIDYPQDWPEALPEIMALLRAVKDADASRLHGGLLVLLRVIKELGTARLRRSQTALQHVAEELLYVLGDIYTSNTTAWLDRLRGNVDGGSDSDTAMMTAMANSLLTLKVLRHVVISGFEQPHRSKLVQEFWSLSLTHVDQFLTIVRSGNGTNGSNGGGGVVVTDAQQDMVGRHLLKFAKMHVDMSETHPSSFAALPNAVALVRAYWGLVADFAEVYRQSGGLRQNASGGDGGGGGGGGGSDGKSSKLEGPLPERLALRGLLLLKSCIQIVTQPVQTFKFRSAETKQEQAEGVAHLKTELFTDEFLLQVVDVIITKLFLFRTSDLEAWDEDPEGWEAQESETGAAWEWQVRPCAERVFLSLLIHHKALLAPPLLAYFQQAMGADADLLAKEAVYTAMGNAAVALDKAFDFNGFLHTTLVRDAQVEGPLARVLRRRVAILLGAWAFYELPPDGLQLVYSAYAHLLNPADAANDEVVRLTAARRLRATVDDVQFRAALFEPQAAGVFSSLAALLQAVESDEAKLAVLETMRTCIERLETIAVRFADGVVAVLPAVWAASAPDTYMIKQAVLSMLATLVMALGAASRPYHALMLPLVADAMDPVSTVHTFLFDEAVELWHSVMNQSAAPLDDALVDLLPRALRVLDYDSQLVPTVVAIVDAYVVLAPAAVLTDRFRTAVLQGLGAAMEAERRWEQVKAAAAVVQKLVCVAPLVAGSVGLAAVVRDLVTTGLLPRMLERLHGAWTARQATGPRARTSSLKTTTAVEYIVILSRIALADPDTFVAMLDSVLPAAAGGVSADGSGNTGGIATAWPWLADEWFGCLDNMGNPEHLKVACLGLTRLCEVGTAPVPELVLGRLQDYLTMWTSSVVDAQGDATQPDCFVWADGPPAPTVYDTPLMVASSAFAAQDPLHTETTYAFVLQRLQGLVTRAGGEQAFETNWMVNVDQDVVAGFRRLTEPRPEG